MPDAPGHALPPGESPGLLLWRVTLRWQREITAALKPLGLTHVQFVLLASTWRLTRVSGETPSQRRIADHAATDVMMTSQVLRALEAKGLVRRERDAGDARTMRVDVTTDGEDLASRAVQVVEATDAAFFATVSDRGSLLAVLTALA